MAFTRLTEPNGNVYRAKCQICVYRNKCKNAEDCIRTLEFYLGQLEDMIESGKLIEADQRKGDE